MNINEYNKVKDFSYRNYCSYLQIKYGEGLSDYMTKSWNKNSKCRRTKEGLLVHHIYEDHAIKLSDKECAMKYPFEWQKAENLAYCDYLEHLYLHILICEDSPLEFDRLDYLGIGGIVDYIVPELNDFYSGWQTAQEWRRNCHNLIRNDKNVYLLLLKRFKNIFRKYSCFNSECLLTSLNEEFGYWSKRQNAALFEEILNL